MDAMQRGTAEEELLFIHRYKSPWILKTTGLVPGFGWLWLWGHDASDTSTSRDSCLRKIAGGDFTTRYAAHHELLWILNNSNELWCYRLKISWAARTSLHQEEAPRVVASWNCCNCGLRVAPGDVEVEHGGTLLWGHGVTWAKANGKKSLCPYGRRYAHNVTLMRLKCRPKKPPARVECFERCYRKSPAHFLEFAHLSWSLNFNRQLQNGSCDCDDLHMAWLCPRHPWRDED